MNRPPFEVADIIRMHGNSFVERNRSWLTWLHLRILFAIEHCRTAALGGHLDRCRQCGFEATSFNSCRSRHCPKCQTNARNKWIAERGAAAREVRTCCFLQSRTNSRGWRLQNKKIVYDLLFRSSAATLSDAADPKHLGAGQFLNVLHTWGQSLQIHPSPLRVPINGSPDHQRVHPRCPPVKVLSPYFAASSAV
jgi:predicted Zn-ribbon and HTH transcriptional regulator